MPRKRAFLLDALATASVSLVRAAGAGAAFLFAAVASSELGPADAGVFFVSITWAYVLAVLARWGASDLILMTFAPLARSWRRVALPAMLARYVHNALLRLVFLAFPVLFALQLLILQGVLPSAGIDIAFICALALPLTMQQLLSAALKAAGKPVTASLIEFCFISFFALAAYLLFRAEFGADPLRGFEILYLCGAVISSLILLGTKTLRISWVRPLKPSAMQATLHRGSSFAIIELCSYLATWSSLLMMPFFLSAHETGIYNAAQRICTPVQFIAISIPTILMPRLAMAYRSRDLAKTRRLLVTMRQIMLVAGLVIFLATVSLGRFALDLFGPAFGDGYTPLVIISAGLCLALALGPAGASLSIMGKEHIFRNVTVLGAVLTIFALIPAMYFHGIIGAAAVTAFSAVARKAVLVWYEGRAGSRMAQAMAGS